MTMLKVLDRPVQIAASTTNQVVKEWGNDAEQSLRVSIFVGQVVGTTAALNIQSSTDFKFWDDIKSVTLTASTDKTVTFTASSADITSSAHGFAVGDQISFISTGGTLPSPLVAGVVYTVSVAATNSFQVKVFPGEIATPTTIPTSTGSGTMTACIVREFSIPVQALVSGDQAYTPVRNRLRLRASTGSGEAAQLVRVWASI